MKNTGAALLATMAWCAALGATPPRQQPQAQKPPAAPSQQKPPAQSAAAAPSEPPLVTEGRVGESNYGWTNGRAWFTLDDTAKVAMVIGIEQGLILSVRENWNAVPKGAQPVLMSTAGRLTITGMAFNDMVEQMNEFYLDATNIDIPVVDDYLYVVLKAKQVPAAELNKFLDQLRKTYSLGPIPSPGPKKP